MNAFSPVIAVKGVDIGSLCPPRLVAEISCNHLGRFDLMTKLIDSAKEARCDFVKIQSFKVEQMVQPSMLDKPCNFPPWNKITFRDLYKVGALSFPFIADTFKYAKSVKMPLFSSVFHPDMVEFLETLDCPAYKISGLECNYSALIDACAMTRKPVFISVGPATSEDLEAIYKIFQRRENRKLCLLYGHNQYPLAPEKVYLRNIHQLRQTFGGLLGFSDHTKGIGSAIASVMLGVSLIEKHFILRDHRDTLDASFSLAEAAMRILSVSIKEAWEANRSLMLKDNLDHPLKRKVLADGMYRA